MEDNFFSQSVVYLCNHNTQGAMGLTINKPSPITMDTIFSTTGKRTPKRFVGKEIMLGGPLQPDRGFVLHTPIGNWSNTLTITDTLALTTSRDIIDNLSQENEVQQVLLAIGYSNWDAGQLEKEIAQNAWLVAPAEEAIVFDLPIAERYNAAMATLGIRPENLMGAMGHA